MRSTLISDAHLSALDDPNQRVLVDFLRTWQTDEWVLVGDIFDVWWDWRHAAYSAYVPLLSTLWEQRNQGVRICWVPGNHDFRPGPFLEDLGVIVAPRWIRHLGELRVLAVHGDEMERSLGQRVLNRVLRGRTSRVMMRFLGPDLGWRSSHWLSGTSRRFNGTTPSGLLERQAAWADTVLGSQADVVCMGHSHAPGVEQRDEGMLVNLGDWLAHHTFAVVEDNVRLFHWRDGGAVPVVGRPQRREWAAMPRR